MSSVETVCMHFDDQDCCALAFAGEIRSEENINHAFAAFPTSRRACW